MGIVVPAGRAEHDERRGADAYAGQPASAGAGSCRSGTLGAAAIGPDLAVVARAPGWRPTGGTAAPDRALADAGAGPGGERADCPGDGRAAADRAAFDRSGTAGHCRGD